MAPFQALKIAERGRHLLSDAPEFKREHEHDVYRRFFSSGYALSCARRAALSGKTWTFEYLCPDPQGDDHETVMRGYHDDLLSQRTIVIPQFRREFEHDFDPLFAYFVAGYRLAEAMHDDAFMDQEYLIAPFCIDELQFEMAYNYSRFRPNDVVTSAYAPASWDALELLETVVVEGYVRPTLPVFVKSWMYQRGHQSNAVLDRVLDTCVDHGMHIAPRELFASFDDKMCRWKFVELIGFLRRTRGLDFRYSDMEPVHGETVAISVISHFQLLPVMLLEGTDPKDLFLIQDARMKNVVRAFLRFRHVARKADAPLGMPVELIFKILAKIPSFTFVPAAQRGLC